MRALAGKRARAYFPTMVAPATLHLPIDGMTCAACASRVEAALRRTPGVKSAAVSLAVLRARIEPDPENPASPETLVAAVRDAGYDVAPTLTTLSVEGMTCASCVGRVERALADIPGVLDASVNLATGQARVRATAGRAAPAELVEAVAQAGYVAHAGVAEGLVPPPPAGDDRWPVLAAVLLALPFAVDMVNHLAGRASVLPGWLQLSLAVPTQTVLAWPFYRAAVRALRARTGNMDLLVSLGTLAAFAVSLAALAGWGAGHAGHGALHFEAAAMTIAFVRLGRWIETRAKARATEAVRALADLAPTRHVAPGEIFDLKPGDKVPADAELIEGRAAFDEQALTGESHPVERGPGDMIAAGTFLRDGAVRARAFASGADTRVARIARAVGEAQAARLPVERLVDRIAAIFVPAIVALAALTFFGWWLAGLAAHDAILRAAAVLVVACPCALGLATPIAVAVAVGRAAQSGLLVRDPAALEHLRGVSTVAFDKTGTLTEGRPTLVEVTRLGAESEEELLALAGGLQAGSEHPLARGVAEAVAARGLAATPVRDFRAVVGEGVEATGPAGAIAMGGPRLLRRFGLSQAGDAGGDTVVWLVAAGDAPRLMARFVFRDQVRPAAAAAVGRLRTEGLRLALLTGDARSTADAVARALGIDEVRAELTPEGKIAALSELGASGELAMVGDGINDAPALAAAHAGIAMGRGTDVARSSAGLVLLRDDLALVPMARELSRRLHAKITQNLLWAFSYNLVMIPLAVAGVAAPAVAGAAMALSSLAVVGNALTLRRDRTPA